MSLGKCVQDAGRLLGDLIEQNRPAALRNVYHLAIQIELRGRFGLPQIEWCTNQIEGFLEDAAEFEGDSANVDLVAVDFLG